jgi:hypothetical protein
MELILFSQVNCYSKKNVSMPCPPLGMLMLLLCCLYSEVFEGVSVLYVNSTNKNLCDSGIAAILL